ncbi:MAG TPA: hypothetical protein VIV34_01330 [Pseudolabrys sp.]
MIRSLFCASVGLGLAGMTLGITMGIRQDFTLVPVHAHINLLGFVTLFLSALYYRAVPEAAGLVIAKVQAAAAIIGAVVFPAGIACIVLGDRQRLMPVVVSGALIELAGMALFALVVIRTSGGVSAPSSAP